MPSGTLAQDMGRLLREASRDDSAYDKLRKETKERRAAKAWANLRQDLHMCRIVVAWRQNVV